MEALTQNLGTTYYTYDEVGMSVPKIAVGTIYTAAAYLQATKPPADDPNAQLHRQQIKSLALAAKTLNQGQVTLGRNRDCVIITTQSDDRNDRSHR